MPSWGRHGWPRKKETLRLYKDKNGDYFLIEPELLTPDGCFSAIANVLDGPEPSLGSCCIHPSFLLSGRIKRVQWSELPTKWQDAFRAWLPDDTTPESIRGFWIVGQQPAQS